jgi:hypothetical protein
MATKLASAPKTEGKHVRRELTFSSQDEKLAFVSRFLHRKAMEELEGAVQVRQVKEAENPDVRYAKEPVKEKIADAKTKTPRGGTAERHAKRGNFAVMLEPELGFSLHVMDVYRCTGSSRLNLALQERLGAEGLYRLLYEFDPRVKSLKNDEREEARFQVIGLLTENADAIASNLWFGDWSPIRTVKTAIHNRQALLTKFENSEELDSLSQNITRSTKFPGWLAIERNQREINLLAASSLHRLTAQKVMEALGPQLQSSAMELKAAYERGKAFRDREANERREAEQDRNQTAPEQQRELAAGQQVMAADLERERMRKVTAFLIRHEARKRNGSQQLGPHPMEVLRTAKRDLDAARLARVNGLRHGSSDEQQMFLDAQLNSALDAYGIALKNMKSDGQGVVQTPKASMAPPPRDEMAQHAVDVSVLAEAPS